MSHTVSVATKMMDKNALRRACLRLDLPDPVEVTDHRMYDGKTFSGTKIELKDWQYPVIIDQEGEAHYDNFQGRWGEMQVIDQLAQIYTVEAARLQADRMGYQFSEQLLENGDIEVSLTEALSAEEALTV